MNSEPKGNSPSRKRFNHEAEDAAREKGGVNKGTMNVRAHIFVSGKVQGVFFRSNTQREANRRTVRGWIRNHKDGGVEAVLEGEEEDVKAVIEYCRKGPSFARVKDVNVRWEAYTGEFNGFNICFF